MQTIPAYSYLLPLVLLFSIGNHAGVDRHGELRAPSGISLTDPGHARLPETRSRWPTSYGSTSRQTLRLVQLPLAECSIMLGVNQTIMMALGMVVIAAVVGAGGPGPRGATTPSSSNVGEALNAGIAIVAMAIVLDRVTYAWSQRDRHPPAPPEGLEGPAGGPCPDPRLWIPARRTALAVFVGREVLRQQGFPSEWTFSVGGPTDSAVDWITRTLGGVTGAISDILLATPWIPSAISSWASRGGWWPAAPRCSRGASPSEGLTVMSFLCLAASACSGCGTLRWIRSSQVIVGVVLSVVIRFLSASPWLPSDRSNGSRGRPRRHESMPASSIWTGHRAVQRGALFRVIAAVMYALPYASGSRTSGDP